MKRFMSALFVLILVGGLASLSPVTVAMAATSTFNTDLDGWTSNTPVEIGWASTGGNPDGYVRFSDATSNSTAILAPSKFLGDWSALNTVGAITFDHKIFSTGGGFIFLPYRIDITGPGGTAFWKGGTPSGPSDWPIPPDHTATALLREDVWSITSGLWSSLLPNVTGLRIQIELVDNSGSTGGDIAGIDNVHLTPIPAAVWLLGSGLVGLFITRKKLKRQSL